MNDMLTVAGGTLIAAAIIGVFWFGILVARYEPEPEFERLYHPYKREEARLHVRIAGWALIIAAISAAGWIIAHAWVS